MAKNEPEQKPNEQPNPAPAAEAPKLVRVKILAVGCFISDKSKLEKDGKPYERRKLFKDEVWELHPDDAKMLDEKGLAKVVVSW